MARNGLAMWTPSEFAAGIGNTSQLLCQAYVEMRAGVTEPTLVEMWKGSIVTPPPDIVAIRKKAGNISDKLRRMMEVVSAIPKVSGKA
jgi:hypothetical protein